MPISLSSEKASAQSHLYNTTRENKRPLVEKGNRSFPSSPGPLYQNEVKCSAFDKEMIFHSHSNKTHFYKKGCALGLILKVRVFGTRKWPIRTQDK